jgi:hypothetical protein
MKNGLPGDRQKDRESKAERERERAEMKISGKAGLLN